MTKSNIFSENIHPSVKINEKTLLLSAKNILKYYLQDNNIFEKSCLRGQKFKTLSFDILYCGSEKIRQINKKYREKDYPADIITFAIFADSDEKFVFDNEINLGEIIISLDNAAKEAQVKGHPLKDEIKFLISHGIIHLLGVDHKTDREYNFIITAQENALKSLKG